MMKEPLSQSGRFKLALTVMLVQLLSLLLNALDLSLDPTAVHEVANWISGALITLIVARTVRNTAVTGGDGSLPGTGDYE